MLLGDEGKATLNGSAGKGNSRIKNPMGAARILIAISLPLFMIVVGYCMLKKKYEKDLKLVSWQFNYFT
ncbi:MAG: hypothetical protein NHB15_15255 [Methanosarcina barkeri]|nr:hypothetical protein [Methanosarcina sp. ERenArc_MAG2]